MAEVNENILVVRKPCFGLPTGCPQCLSVYIYLHFARLPFHLDFHINYPDSDQIPYFEIGDYVAYNNDKEGIIERLKNDVGVVDLDSGLSSLPDWIPTKAMLTTWLADALAYELWLGSEEEASFSRTSPAYTIYYSDLPWPIGKFLFWKKARWVKQKHGITNDNAEVKKQEIYGRANSAYEALSTWLGEQNYLFEDRPSSLDAIFLAHGLVVLQALPESSMLHIKFLEHANLVRYVQQWKTELTETSPPPSSGPQFHTNASSSSTSRSRSSWSSKPKSKPKREKTQEEKTFKRRAKYFVVAQLVAVVVFLTLMTSFDDIEVEVDDADGGYGYDD